MKGQLRVALCCVLGLAIQSGVYFYFDHYYFAPTADFTIMSGSQEKDGGFPETGEGQKYYSYDHKYMALVTKDSVKIFTRGEKEAKDIDLQGRNVSLFEWMPDRDLAIMGLYGGTKDTVVLARFDPESPEHEADTKIEDLPSGSMITAVAYSTATNVVYMKIKVRDKVYRMYRTDANYDTRRVYMQASDIGHIAVFYDEDRFFYDNAKTGDVFMFNGTEGGWRVINPPGRWRLIGVDKDKNIFIAKVNKDNEALSIDEGRLGVGFKTVYTYDKPEPVDGITMEKVNSLLAKGQDSSKK